MAKARAGMTLTRIDRYLARTLLGSVGLVMAVLVVIGGLFQFIDEQGSVGVGHYGMAEALVFALLNIPRFALNAFPAGVLIGSLLGIGVLARSHELTAMRAGGMSRWRLAGSALGCGLLLMAVGLLVGELLAPRMEQMADERKALARFDSVSFAGAGGAWLRDGNLILNIAERGRGNDFGGMMVFELDGERHLASIARAERASNDADRSWRLSGYAESRFNGEQVSGTRAATHRLASGISAAFLQLAAVQPAELSLRELRRAMDYLRRNQLDDQGYQLAWWSGLARTVAIPIAVLFALPFGFGSMRNAGGGARAALGLVVGLVYFFLQRTVESGTVVFQLDPLLLACLPTGLLGLAAAVLLLRTR
jgi:lipopolysaccharide export system permease protein